MNLALHEFSGAVRHPMRARMRVSLVGLDLQPRKIQTSKNTICLVSVRNMAVVLR